MTTMICKDIVHLLKPKSSMLQFQDIKVGQEKEPYIRVNTREFNEVPSIRLFTLYILDY